MAMERADRASFPGAQTCFPLPLPQSKLPASPSVSSLATAASRTEDCSHACIRNLMSGEVIDLRDECTPGFAEAYALLTDGMSRLEQVRIQW